VTLKGCPPREGTVKLPSGKDGGGSGRALPAVSASRKATAATTAHSILSEEEADTNVTLGEVGCPSRERT
jgi:hypothetical protein